MNISNPVLFAIFLSGLSGICPPGGVIRAEVNTPGSSAEQRLTKSAEALQSFRRAAPDAAQKLLDQAICVGVLPRRDADQTDAAEKGFVSCRSGIAAAFSDPAAISIRGGGVYWPVAGQAMDLILMTIDPSMISVFSSAEELLGTDARTAPGALQADQASQQSRDAVILTYEQSSTGISGINIAGSTIGEDRATNAALYGNDLSNSAILTRRAAKKSAAVEAFVGALPGSGPAQTGEGISR
ncbi:MAG TPA: YSC84-related protein [Bryobacteraceae bacterium]|jgi:lipid-binding SYLF domain-containing protein|nr:YSC84-related protein [Bryobacteraceae bacterium]